MGGKGLRRGAFPGVKPFSPVAGTAPGVCDGHHLYTVLFQDAKEQEVGKALGVDPTAMASEDRPLFRIIGNLLHGAANLFGKGLAQLSSDRGISPLGVEVFA